MKVSNAPGCSIVPRHIPIRNADQLSGNTRQGRTGQVEGAATGCRGVALRKESPDAAFESRNRRVTTLPGPRKRRALAVTTIEDADMASAANRGVAWPVMAKGTAMTL